MMQLFLAQARGPGRNGDLLRQAHDRTLRILAARDGIVRECMDDALMESLTAVVDALDSCGALYAVTGSVASSIHGEPFSSLVVDLIVTASTQQAGAASRRLAGRFYAPEEMLVDAARDSTMTNVVDNRTGLKIDLSFAAAGGYLGDVMRRRVRTRIGNSGPEFWIVTPEDVILMKLLWRKDTQSVKQWENALGVARVQGARMNWKYLWDQAEKLGISDDLTRLRDEAGI